MNNYSTNLTGKNILITGSTSGIGLACAKACLQAGAQVMLHGSSIVKMEKTFLQLNKQFPQQVLQVVADLEQPADINKIVANVNKQWSKLHGLVNNAGIFPRDQVEVIPTDFFDKIFAINVRAPTLLISKLLDQFPHNDAAILNIGSINAFCGQTDLLVYSMSKGALMTLTRNLGNQLFIDRGIRVNQLNVGWTLTSKEAEIQRQQGKSAGWEQRISKTIAPSGGLLLPDDIARHAVFWLSNSSAPVSGQVYEVEQYPLIGRPNIYPDGQN